MIARTFIAITAAILAAGCQAIVTAPALPPGTQLNLERVAEPPAAQAPAPVTTAARPSAPPAGTSPSAPSAAAPGNAGGDRSAPVHGRVVSIGPAGERPLAGANVTLGDGSRVVTDAAGAFTFPRSPADGLYLASAPGHVASSVAGLGGTTVTLRLQPRGGAKAAQPTALTEAPFHATGRLVDHDGTPVPGVDVILSAPDGAVGLPVTTDSDGRFAIPVFAPGRAVTDASLLALGGDGASWVGRIDGLSCSAAVPALQFATPTRTDALVVARATHRLRVEVDATAVPTAPTTTLFLTSPHGQRLAVPREADGTYAVAPSADYSLEIAAQGDGWRSVVVRDRLPFPAAQTAATVKETLLAPPALTLGQPDAPLTGLRWASVEGARGYWLTLSEATRPGQSWEGFTALTTLAPPVLDPGEHRLTVAALDAAGLDARSVSSLPRRLVVTHGPGGYRQATRDVLVTLP